MELQYKAVEFANVGYNREIWWVGKTIGRRRYLQ